MKSPHVSPEPLPFLTDGVSNQTEKPPTRSIKSGWTSKHIMYKKKSSTLTKENLEVFNNSVDDKRYPISPYYKGLLFTEKAPGTSSEAEGTTPIAHEFQNLNSPSPYYKGLLYTEKIPGTSLEAEHTTAMQHDLMINTSSPYYKGLLNQATSPDRESVATTVISSSSKTSFSVKMHEWGVGCFLFRAKDEKPPTMLKVYSTENSTQESLRERGSEPASPRSSPTLPPQSSPPPLLSPTLSPQSPPPPPPLLSPSSNENEEVTIEPKNEKKYKWADRYRPVTLKDFICHKDKAIELKSSCAAIILREADKLSTDALLYIRWVIERYRGCHKVFFCCQDASKLQHLMNICKLIQFLPLGFRVL